MDLYYTFSLLVVLTALFSYLNSRYLKLPSTIGIMILAIIILGIACINYINLSTAQAAKRAKEVGVRKLIGAGRGSRFAQ